jgi:hypothetical protein
MLRVFLCFMQSTPVQIGSRTRHHVIRKFHLYIFFQSTGSTSLLHLVSSTAVREVWVRGDTVKVGLSANGGFIVFPAGPMDGHGVSRIYVQFVLSQPEVSFQDRF